MDLSIIMCQYNSSLVKNFKKAIFKLPFWWNVDNKEDYMCVGAEGIWESPVTLSKLCYK